MRQLHTVLLGRSVGLDVATAYSPVGQIGRVRCGIASSLVG